MPVFHYITKRRGNVRAGSEIRLSGKGDEEDVEDRSKENCRLFDVEKQSL
jgi:hypothetical protein